MVNIEKYLKQLETVVNIDCGSYNPDGINKVADCFMNWYRELGWHVKSHDLGPKTGYLLEISNRVCSHYDIMFIGHLDTVFPDGTAAERPYYRKGNKCYGPGVSDMKNGDLAMLHIAKNLSPTALEKLNICMCYNPDEEIGSIYSKNVTDAIARRSDCVFIMESASGGGSTHCFQRKGSLNYEIKFHGKAGHAGFMFELDVASAVVEMGHYITEIAKLADQEKGTTVNIGIANGGIAANVVPDHAQISVDMRFKDPAEKGRLSSAIQDMIAAAPYEPGVTTEITYKRCIAPWNQTEKGRKFINYVRGIAAREKIPFAEKDRGGLSDANHLAVVCPICMDGMGPGGRYDHSPKEFCLIDSIDPCVKLLVAVLEDVATHK